MKLISRCFRFLRRIIRRFTLVSFALAIGLIAGTLLTGLFTGGNASPATNSGHAPLAPVTAERTGNTDPALAAESLVASISKSLMMSPQGRRSYLKDRVDPVGLDNVLSSLDASSATMEAALALPVNADNSAASYTYAMALEKAQIGGVTQGNLYTVDMINLVIVGNTNCSRALDSRGLTVVVIKRTATGWLYVSSQVKYEPQVILRNEDKMSGTCFGSLVTEYRKEGG